MQREYTCVKDDMVIPLITSRLGNQQALPKSFFRVSGLPRRSSTHVTLSFLVFDIDVSYAQKTDFPSTSSNPLPIIDIVPIQAPTGLSGMEQFMERLSKHQGKIARQTNELNALNGHSSRSTSRSPSEQPSDPYAVTPRTGSKDASDPVPDPAEVLRLKQELIIAQSQIARMDQEISQSRITKHTMEQALGSQFDPDFDHTRDLGPQPLANRVDNWVQQTESVTPAVKFDGGAPARGIWNAGFAPPTSDFLGGGVTMPPSSWALPSAAPVLNAMPDTRMAPPMNNNFYAMGTGHGSSLNVRQQQPALRLDTTGVGSYFNEPSPAEISMRSSGQSSRPPSAFGNHLQPWSSLNTNGNGSDQTGITPPMTPLSFQGMHGGTMDGMPPIPSMHPMQQHMSSNMNQPGMQSYIPRPIGTRLSPTAAEFHRIGGFDRPAPWHMQQQVRSRPSSRTSHCTDMIKPGMESPASYMSTAEPMNYRRLLDRNMSCNWKYIVDKIVHSNDQQASIFLQQKLKVGTSEQKFEIVQAIIDQAYPLMVNRFGNFLVQRCFEHGTPEQVISIARAIRGNTLNLSMDAFGCHVVQKAFDCVPEEYKAIMVHELLRRIPETVIHRYACHVWQKLFELRWSDSPPQIMKYVNEALRGMWHEVALGETGSLVVQNIFENCLEEDKVCLLFPALLHLLT